MMTSTPPQPPPRRRSAWATPPQRALMESLAPGAEPNDTVRRSCTETDPAYGCVDWYLYAEERGARPGPAGVREDRP